MKKAYSFIMAFLCLLSASLIAQTTDVIIGLNTPTRTIIVDNSMYICNYGEGTILKVDDYTSVIPVVETLFENLNGPYGLLRNNDEIYIADSDGAAISKFNITEANPSLTPIVTTGLTGPTAMLLVGDEMYVSDYQEDKIVKVDLAAQNPIPVEVVDAASPDQLVLAGDFIYYAEYYADKVSKIDITAATPTATDVVTGVGGPSGLLLVGNDLYIAEYDAGKISKIDITLDAPTAVDVLTGLSGPTDIAIVGDDYYITEFDGNKISKFLNLPVNYLFEESTVDIPNYYYSSISSADFDADGDMDFAISGALDPDEDTFPDSSAVDIYINENGDFSPLVASPMYGLHLGAVQFIDVDYDGDQDLITTGQNYEDIYTYHLKVYENNNGTLSERQSLDGYIYASLSTGDYDLDGDLDLLVSGAVQTPNGASVKTAIYSNNAGMLEESSIELPGVQNGDAQFGDLDNDGDVDILIMGLDANGDYLLNFYENTDATFVLKQEMPGMYYGTFSISDYDNDGDLDFAIMGDDTDDNYAAMLYHNEEGVFSVASTLTGVDNASGYSPIAWGDINNDGYRDLVMSGTDEDYEDVTFLYTNDGENITAASEGLRNLGGNAALNFLDADNDNDLDLIIAGLYYAEDYVADVVLHNNLSENTNLAPSAPQGLTATNVEDTHILFTWDRGVDDTTDDLGLYYHIKVLRDSDSQIMADYTVHGNSLTLALPWDNYTWSIQSVDASDVYSQETTAFISLTSVINISESQIEVFPNPAIDVLSVDYELEGTLLAEIFNNTGQLVWQGQLNDKQIRIEHLVAGMYSLVLNTENGDSYSAKFIKE